jgi:hypothetical protein
MSLEDPEDQADETAAAEPTNTDLDEELFRLLSD